MTGLYTLDENGDAQPATRMEDILNMKGEKRIVGRDTVGKYLISTVFLCVNHRFSEGPPVLWETMVFNGRESCFCDRYETRKEAEEGHKLVVDRLKRNLKENKNEDPTSALSISALVHDSSQDPK